MDFTLDKYRQLLKALLKANYKFVTYSVYISNPSADEKVIILRHDVDAKPKNSMKTAQIEKELGVVATYYFRAVPESWNEPIIRQISSLGHEVGYHYESLTTCHGDVSAAYSDFIRNLERLRDLVTVSSICMHGSPRSPYDSKDIWKSYDYFALNLVGEPYLDTDFSKIFYLTDTGRRWDGFKTSVRDKIPVYQEIWRINGLIFHTTDDLLLSIQNNKLPDKIMITTHPQRWTDNKLSWIKELIFQRFKNCIKRLKLIFFK
jgi:hypothetical protein